MPQGGGDNQEVVLPRWDPQRYAKQVDPLEVRFSRGFLRCRPEKWFPGFAAQWLPLAHSLGVELKIVEVKPVIAFPKSLPIGFAGTIDDEPIAILTDDNSLDAIFEAVSPGIGAHASKVVGQYIARRFLTSLALSWSGPEASVVRFNAEILPQDVAAVGAIKVGIDIRGTPATVWIVLGRMFVERLDGLWRRQVRSSAKQFDKAPEVSLEVAQLAVPPSMLIDYMKSEAGIDLELPPSDALTLKLGGKPWLPGKLVTINGNLGFEIAPGPVFSPPCPDGTTRLSIEFGTVRFDAGTIAEMAQVGAIWDTGVKLTNRVSMVVNGERVAEATLCLYEGRLAISVD